MQNRADEYELRATNCLSLANTAQLADVRLRMLDLAAYWQRLAMQARKNSALDLVYEWSP